MVPLRQSPRWEVYRGCVWICATYAHARARASVQMYIFSSTFTTYVFRVSMCNVRCSILVVCAAMFFAGR